MGIYRYYWEGVLFLDRYGTSNARVLYEYKYCMYKYSTTCTRTSIHTQSREILHVANRRDQRRSDVPVRVPVGPIPGISLLMKVYIFIPVATDKGTVLVLYLYHQYT